MVWPPFDGGLRAAARRFASVALSLWVIATLSFLLLYGLPGDPARIILGPQASAETVTAFRRAEGLDRGLAEQYARYLMRTTRLDLGTSFSLRRPVNQLLRERGLVTLRLALLASVLVLVVGFLLPVALRLVGAPQGVGTFERLLGLLALVPPYVLATAGLMIGAGWLRWINAIFDPTRLVSWLIPAAVLSAYPAALVLKIFAGRLAEELRSPYALRARALGMTRRYVLLREVLPNALPAALAALVNGLAYFLTSTFFVEAVFGIPGLGRLAQDALRNKDVALLSGICLLFACGVIALSALIDALQDRLDPRAFQRASHG